MIIKNTFFRYVHSLFLISCLFSGGTSLIAQPGQYNHPELYWQSLETEHFIVHYHQGTERTANLVAKIAEEIYPHITGFYQHWPADKTEFIIRDTDDYSNGGAYFYENKIEIWAENMDYILRGTHNWLRNVVSHEFSHIISMQKALKFGTHVPAGWLQGFGYESERRPDVVRGFPNVLVSYPISGITIPVWFAEGIAQYQSPDKKYDYRDSHREMILRDRVVTGNLLDLNEMSVFGKNSVGNESSYNQGYAFVNFLSENFGDSIMARLAKQAGAPFSLNFNGVLHKVTGMPADSIFEIWNEYLLDTYQQKLNTVKQNLKEGEPLRSEGIGNIHPVFSPNGKKVAYLKSISEYISANALVILDLETGGEKMLAGPIASSISWSPNGRYITYAKQTALQANGSSFYDLYVYDTIRYKDYRITKGLRATNPDWSHDGQQMAFVVHSDGITNLFTIKLDEFVWIKNKKLWHTRYYDLYSHRLIEKIPKEKKKNWQRYFRKVQFWGQGIRQLTHMVDGRQIFHPRWALNDSLLVFDTSTDFCRDIATIPASGGELNFLLDHSYDERYPIFDRSSGEIFYASDQTGIFNIYSYNLNNGKIKAHTNVIGGAFMPSINERGDLIYSLYKDQAYQIYLIKKVNALPPEHLRYDDSYEAKIPVIQADDSKYSARTAKPYNRSFGPVGIMPRLIVDYGTIKPGLYIYSNEVINKMFFLGGMDFNLRKDYDIFGLFEFNLFNPSIFLAVFNQSTNIEDRLTDPFYQEFGNHEVNFNLLEANLGLRADYRNQFSWELSYIFSLYRARIGTFAYKELATNDIFVSPDIRYEYLRGHALSLALRRSRIIPEIDRAINPRRGYYISFRYTREWNRFLDGFATDRVIDLEIFKKYYFNRYQIDVEKYFPVPFTKHHSISARIQGGYIDKEVDDFFHFFAGGFVGLKGYNYYSIDGNKLAIASFAYRFPLIRNLNFQIFNWYLDKIYLGTFYQFGNAWIENGIPFDDFKSDFGFQLRLESFSWYMFPTRIFFEAAYPLKVAQFDEIVYDREWKFYFGILFDFDIRLDKTIRRFI